MTSSDDAKARATVTYNAAARGQVRQANLEYVRRSRLKSVEANVVYAIATKP